MKRWIIGAALLGYIGAAYGAGWVEIASSPGQTEWAMRAQAPEEVWEKFTYNSPQAAVGFVYNQEVSLDKINCSQGSVTKIQGSYYINGSAVWSSSPPLRPFYAPPGTFAAALISDFCKGA